MVPVAASRTAAPPAVRLLVRPLHLWHLLSLDAPTVATLWTAFVARSVRVRLPLPTLAAMFLAVWTLYAADRLLDARPLLRHALPSGLEARHLFHHRHRTAFLLALVPVTLALSLLLPRLDPAAIHLHLVLGSLLIGYFVLIHATGSAARLPKEIAVGLFFSAACFIPTVARQPLLRLTLAPAAVLFAALCSLNCLTIFALENPTRDGHTSHPSAHPLTRLATHHLRSLGLLLLSTAALVALVGPVPSRLPAAATALAATLLLLLARLARRHSPRSLLGDPTTLRSLADLALITPLLLLPWLPPR